MDNIKVKDMVIVDTGSMVGFDDRQRELYKLKNAGFDITDDEERGFLFERNVSIEDIIKSAGGRIENVHVIVTEQDDYFFIAMVEIPEVPVVLVDVKNGIPSFRARGDVQIILMDHDVQEYKLIYEKDEMEYETFRKDFEEIEAIDYKPGDTPKKYGL